MEFDINDFVVKHFGGNNSECARALGVTHGTVWQWRNGRTRITPQRAAQIRLWLLEKSATGKAPLDSPTKRPVSLPG